MDLLTSNQDIDAVELGDKTVELVAFVASKDAPREVGQEGKKYTLLKFLLENKNGKIIQCAAWDDNVPVVNPKIIPGSIIHVNGVYANEVKSNFNKGNVMFELVFKKDTMIETLDTEECILSVEPIPVQILLEDIANNKDTLIVVEAFLKSPLKSDGYASAPYGTAAICDCKEAKVAIKVTEYISEQVDEDKAFKVGEKLKLQGYPRVGIDKFRKEKLWLEIKSVADIETIPGPIKTFSQMIKCVKSPKRKAEVELGTTVAVNIKKPKCD